MTLSTMERIMNGYNIETLKMIADEGGLEAVCARGYNEAKREIALSGEYERIYDRGKSDQLDKVFEIIDWRISLLGNTIADGLIKQELDIVKTTIIKELNEE